MHVCKFNSQVRSRQRVKMTAVAFGVVIAIMLGLFCLVSSFSELKREDKAYHMTRNLRALDQSALAEETEREFQSTMLPVTTPSTTSMPIATGEAEQGQTRHLLLGRTIGALLSAISPQRQNWPTQKRLRTMPPANTLTSPADLEDEQGTNTTDLSPAFTEAELGDAKEEIFQDSSTAASRADKHIEAAAGSAAMSDDAEVGDIDARMHNGEWVFASDTSGSEDSDSSSDSIGCSSEDSVDSGSKDSDDSGSDSSDSVSISCNETTSIMNKW